MVDDVGRELGHTCCSRRVGNSTGSAGTPDSDTAGTRTIRGADVNVGAALRVHRQRGVLVRAPALL